ncbi:hypothetical protein [Shewanella algae]|uniref:hypothetical protein n=1 Tax=Shewanella algae TaxID=38313 RepID=UPI0031F5BEAE
MSEDTSDVSSYSVLTELHQSPSMSPTAVGANNVAEGEYTYERDSLMDLSAKSARLK